jgi:alpha-galactosidase
MSRIVLIGAGSAQFGFDTLGDIFQSRVLSGSSVVLHDINKDALDRVYATAGKFIEEQQLRFSLSATTDRRQALPGADFIVISIEPGDRFALWEQDWKVPCELGIRQVYGENGGPGGLFHSLRIIPPILEICRDIRSLCPGAQVFNYSNPMSRICFTVLQKFPDLKFTGLCHEVFSLKRHLPLMLNTPLEDLHIRAGGLNHFSVLLQIRYKNLDRDAYPDVRRKALDYFKDIPGDATLLAQLVGGEVATRPRAERWLFAVMLEKFGVLPITIDSHFGEYLQWAHEVVDHRGIADFYSQYKLYSSEKKPGLELNFSEERAVPVMEGILTDSGHEELAVNIRNAGCIENLPPNLVVEVPATVTKAGVEGVRLGALPKGIAGLLQNQVAVHELTAEAVLKKSKSAALQALLVDPVVASVKAAEKILEKMLVLQAPFLDYLK